MSIEVNEIRTIFVTDDSSIRDAQERTIDNYKKISTEAEKAGAAAKRSEEAAASATNEHAKAIRSAADENRRFMSELEKFTSQSRFTSGAGGRSNPLNNPRKGEIDAVSKLIELERIYTGQVETRLSRLKAAHLAKQALGTPLSDVANNSFQEQLLNRTSHNLFAGQGPRVSGASQSEIVRFLAENASVRDSQLAPRIIEARRQAALEASRPGLFGTSGGVGRRTAFSAVAAYAGSNVPGVTAGVGAFEMSRLAGVSSVGAAGIGLAGAAGQMAIAVSEKLKKQAEERLSREEKITGEYNRQYFAMKNASDIFERQRQMATQDRQWNRDFERNSNNVGALEGYRTQAESELARLRARRRELGSKEGNIAFAGQIASVDAEIQQIESRINQLDATIETASRRHTGFTSEQIALNKAAAEASKQRWEEEARLLQQAYQKAKDYGQVAQDLFVTVADRQTNNPFVQILTQASASMDEVERKTVGLSKTFRDEMKRMVESQSQTRLFEARIDNTLGILDLRDTAQRFRSGENTRLFGEGESQEQYLQRIRNLRRSYGITDQFRAGESPDWRVRISAEAGARAQEMGGISDFHTQSIAAAFYRNLERQQAFDLRPQARLQRQIDALDGLRPESDEERASIERRLIDIGQGLDPNTLNRDQRIRLAEAMENEATRRERFEMDARDQEAKKLVFIEQLSKDVSALIDIARKGGPQALNNEITVKDETESGISVKKKPKRPSPKDTQRYYAGQLNFSQGSSFTNN